PRFERHRMKPVIIALTASGLATAKHAAAAIGGDVHMLAKSETSHQPSPHVGEGGARDTPPRYAFTDTASHLRALFSEGRPIIGICAAGILIRILAPLLSDKRQ